MTEDTQHVGGDAQLANEPIHDVLRNILSGADEPLSYDEIEERLRRRLQAGIRGLDATGELQGSTQERSRYTEVYEISEAQNHG